MGETARAHMLKIMERYSDVEEWRAKQKDPGDLNHPSRVWVKYERSTKQVDEATKAKRAEAQKARSAKDVEGLQEHVRESEDEIQRLKDEVRRLEGVVHAQEDEIAHLKEQLAAIEPGDPETPGKRRIEPMGLGVPLRDVLDSKERAELNKLQTKNIKSIEDELNIGLNAALSGTKPKRRKAKKATA